MAIAPQRSEIGIRRHFTTPGVHPYDEVRWERRDARITNFRDGTVAFEQLGVEVPESWSVNATNILAQKYFRGTLGTEEREWSLKQVADRVADTLTAWGIKDGYFVDDEEAQVFNHELKYLIIHQRAAFNSPVWFNIGVPACRSKARRASSSRSRTRWTRSSTGTPKRGSSSRAARAPGSTCRAIRSSHELLKGGGTASGPVSFMRGADASAGTIKSGGKTRRAAKMVILDADHPDVEDFIWCKAIEERKARVLRDAGFDMDLDGADSHSTQYQNANNSVRVTDEFMQAVIDGDQWELRARTDGSVIRTVPARDLFRQIAHSAWECADPGLQYDTTINRWHTAPNTGRINGSNPCSRIRSPRQQRVQSGIDEPAHLPRRQRRVRRRGVQGGGGGGLHRPGDHRRQRRLPDREDRRDDPGLPRAGHRLRQPGRAAHGAGPALRLGRGPGLGGRHHGAAHRARLRHLRPHGGAHGTLRRIPREPGADARRPAHAPGRGGPHRRGRRAARTCSRRPRRPGTARSTWPRSTACATRRPRCWRRPAPSGCSWTATPPASSPTWVW